MIVNSSIRHTDAHWYVMAAYRYELKAEEFLTGHGFKTFLPKETTFIKKPHRHPVAVERPAVPSLIFIHTSREKLAEVKKYVNDRIKYLTTTVGGTQDFLIVPDTQMDAFIHIWNSRDSYNANLSSDLIPTGATVRIISGPMAGLTGIHLRHLKARPLTPGGSPVPHSRLSLRLANLLAITLDLPTASLQLSEVV